MTKQSTDLNSMNKFCSIYLNYLPDDFTRLKSECLFIIISGITNYNTKKKKQQQTTHTMLQELTCIYIYVRILLVHAHPLLGNAYFTCVYRCVCYVNNKMAISIIQKLNEVCKCKQNIIRSTVLKTKLVLYMQKQIQIQFTYNLHTRKQQTYACMLCMHVCMFA